MTDSVEVPAARKLTASEIAVLWAVGNVYRGVESIIASRVAKVTAERDKWERVALGYARQGNTLAEKVDHLTAAVLAVADQYERQAPTIAARLRHIAGGAQ